MADRIGLSLVGGLVSGAAVTYYLDPHLGRRRRAIFLDKLDHLGHLSLRALDVGSRDLAFRAKGVFATGKSRLIPLGEIDDDILVDRVRSKLGRYVSHPHSIDVSCQGGVCTLRGLILAHEVKPLMNAVYKVKGIRSVRDELDAHRKEERISALQGGRPKMGERLDFLQTNWAPGTRLWVGALSGAAGLFALRQIRRGNPLGFLLGAASDVILARALTNLEARRLFGLKGRQGVSFHKTININAPVEKVYEFWSNVENFPRFMTELKEVRITGDRTSHWVARGPAGAPVSWDAEISGAIANRVLAWRSTPGSVIGLAGQAKFFPVGNRQAKIELDFTYNPPGGFIGHELARIFGADPKSRLEWALAQMKQILEQGPSSRQSRAAFR